MIAHPFILAALGMIGIAATGKALASEGGNPVKNDPILANQNLRAFMAVIRAGESNDNYRALVGGGEFSGVDDHPALTGEFSGITRADGRLTTAAGAYQITRTTWSSLGGVARYGDFDTAAQDTAALDLLRRRGALGAVIDGDIARAVELLRNEWEFLTQWDVSRVAMAFERAGGATA